MGTVDRGSSGGEPGSRVIRREKPGLRPGLHHRFARLSTQEEVRKFANAFGWLGRKATIHVGEGTFEPDEERLDDWQEEAAAMAALIAVANLVKERSRKELGQFVVWGQEDSVDFRAVYNRRGGISPWQGRAKAHTVTRYSHVG